MGKSFTLGEFLKTYSSDYDCLKEIVNIKYPDGIFCKKCKVIIHHCLLKTRPVLSCSKCYSQTYPLKGTIFAHSTTPLKFWFILREGFLLRDYRDSWELHIRLALECYTKLEA